MKIFILFTIVVLTSAHRGGGGRGGSFGSFGGFGGRSDSCSDERGTGLPGVPSNGLTAINCTATCPLATQIKIQLTTTLCACGCPPLTTACTGLNQFSPATCACACPYGAAGPTSNRGVSTCALVGQTWNAATCACA